jgi:hypothetical protein
MTERSVRSNPSQLAWVRASLQLSLLLLFAQPVAWCAAEARKPEGAALPSATDPRIQQGYYESVYRERSPFFVKENGWVASLLKSKANLGAVRERRAVDVLWADFCQAYPLQSDWLIQDRPEGMDCRLWTDRLLLEPVTTGVVQELMHRAGTDAGALAVGGEVREALEAYGRSRELRRARFLKQLPDGFRTIIFAKSGHDMLSGANHYSYTEALSDHSYYFRFQPGSALCVLEVSANGAIAVREVLASPEGVIRDPDVSFDGKRILFAWKKSAHEDDYHLYELEVASGAVRQLTRGLGHADYEAIYLPNGDILFNSTRCVQSIDCDFNVVSALYTCDGDGRYLRRLGFDQVTVNYPQLLPDGRVIYTRWEYNDRSQVWPQPLFLMNSDGTGQTEYYGNNSWFPTSLLHARPIPGTRKVLAVLSGHHANQKGKLGIVDVALGNQENIGITLVAPESKPAAVRVDQWGVEGDQFKHPYPLSENLYLAAYSACAGFPVGTNARSLGSPFWLYLVDRSGNRELLAADADLSCVQPVPLAPRAVPAVRPSVVDYRKKDATIYMRDIYRGPGLQGVPRGSIRSLRVVALEFRHFPIGSVGIFGPGGGSACSTPIALPNGSYDVKRVLGEVDVCDDGSAFFRVPARTPLYFQAVDRNGYVAQTMRSWSTLQPGETLSCVGCHESKYEVSPPADPARATQRAPQELRPFYGPARAFGFRNEIQPILDRHCVRCHDGDRSGSPAKTKGDKPFSLRGDEAVVLPNAKRKFSDSYLYFCSAGKAAEKPFHKDGIGPNPLVNWMNVQEVPTLLPPYHAGAAKSKLMTLLRDGHNKVKLSSEELDKIACWIDLLVPYCADYTESNDWTPQELAAYEKRVQKRRDMEAVEQQNIREFIEQRQKP